MSNPVENEDYIIIDNPNKEVKWACIKILKKPYENVIIEYGKLSFADKENDDGSLNANFDYNIIDKANLDIDKLNNDNAFSNLLGDIIIDVLQNYIRERDQDEIKPIGDNDIEGVDQE